MASNSNVGFKRSPPKTYSAYNSLPSLRHHASQRTEKSPERKFKRPPQFADQLMFPGRRLDRRQNSTYSGYSGRSLDIETIVSGGRPETTGSGAGPPGVTPGLPTSAGLTKSLNDVREQSWDSVRQLPSAGNHMTSASRHVRSQNMHDTAGNFASNAKTTSHVNGLNNLHTLTNNTGNFFQNKGNTVHGIAGKGLRGTFAGASVSLGNLSSNQLNHTVPGTSATGSLPVAKARWRSLEQTNRSGQDELKLKVLPRDDSPDSSYSSESMSDTQSRSSYSPVPALNLSSPQSQTQPLTKLPPQPQPHQKPNLQRQLSKSSSTNSKTMRPRYLKKSTRHNSEVSGDSPTPQLDKILWALVPDEFANISDTGVSDMEPQTTLHDSASSRYVTFTDLEAKDGATSRVPNTPRRPLLTQETLSQFAANMPNDDRIMQWLADCDHQTTSMSLPTHLPDISYTFKYVDSNS